MEALDSLPQELRLAVKQANYSVHDVLTMAAQIRFAPNAAPQLVRQLQEKDAQLTRQRSRQCPTS